MSIQVDPLLTVYADVIIYINIRTFRFKDKNNYEYDYYDLIWSFFFRAYCQKKETQNASLNFFSPIKLDLTVILLVLVVVVFFYIIIGDNFYV